MAVECNYIYVTFNTYLYTHIVNLRFNKLILLFNETITKML